MKNLSLIINAVLAVAIGVLFYLHFSCKNSCTAGGAKVSGGAVGNGKGAVVAYVDIDSLEDKYQFFIEKKAELEKRQSSIQATLQTKAQGLQKEVYDLQQKASTMTQSEGEEAQRKLYAKQGELEQMRDGMGKQFMGEQEAFNKQLQAKLDSFIQKYNADKRFNYILSYSKGGAILYKDEQFNITKDVIEGMNKEYKK